MKVVLRGSSFLASLLGSDDNAAVPQASLLLRRGCAGDVRIGMSAKGLTVRPEDLTIEIQNGAVNAIRVHSPRYKTEADIGVGDSLIKLASQYPVYWSGDHVAEVAELGMKFQMEEGRIVSILVL